MVHVNIPVPWSICETSLGEARSTGGTETLETVGDHSHSQPNNGNKKHDISRNVLLEHSWNQRFLFFKNFLFLKSFGRWLAIWISPTNPTKKNWSLFFLLKRSRGSRTMSFLIVFHVDVVEANFRMLDHAKPPQKKNTCFCLMEGVKKLPVWVRPIFDPFVLGRINNSRWYPGSKKYNKSAMVFFLKSSGFCRHFCMNWVVVGCWVLFSIMAHGDGRVWMTTTREQLSKMKHDLKNS